MEILVVSTLIVVLALILLIGINPLTQILKGFDARRRSDLNKIKIAFEAYYSDHDCYPDESVLSQCGSGALQPYLVSVPCDPNTQKPYKISVLPEGSSCPQQFAVYASITSLFTTDAISSCPNTFAVYSSSMGTLDLARGCAYVAQACTNVYGCRNGACTVVAVDEIATCGPNYCTSDCDGNNCATQRPNGSFVNECL